MNRKFNKAKKSIILLIVLLLILTIGYAIFNDNLTVTGTANAKGNFDVIFSSATLKTANCLGIDTENTTAVIESDDDTVTINVKDLTSVNGHANFEITIQNNSYTSAELKDFTITGLDESIFDVSGYSELSGVVLSPSGQEDDSKTFELIVKLKDGATIDSENVNASFTLSLQYGEV